MGELYKRETELRARIFELCVARRKANKIPKKKFDRFFKIDKCILTARSEMEEAMFEHCAIEDLPSPVKENPTHVYYGKTVL